MNDAEHSPIGKNIIYIILATNTSARDENKLHTHKKQGILSEEA